MSFIIGSCQQSTHSGDKEPNSISQVQEDSEATQDAIETVETQGNNEQLIGYIVSEGEYLFNGLTLQSVNTSVDLKKGDTVYFMKINKNLDVGSGFGFSELVIVDSLLTKWYAVSKVNSIDLSESTSFVLGKSIVSSFTNPAINKNDSCSLKDVLIVAKFRDGIITIGDVIDLNSEVSFIKKPCFIDLTNELDVTDILSITSITYSGSGRYATLDFGTDIMRLYVIVDLDKEIIAATVDNVYGIDTWVGDSIYLYPAQEGAKIRPGTDVPYLIETEQLLFNNGDLIYTDFTKEFPTH